MRYELPDPNTSELISRALDVSGEGSVLVQSLINKTVFEISNRAFGAWTTLEHKPGSGDAHYLNRRTVGTTGGAYTNDTTAPTEETGSYAQVNFPYRRLITRGNVSDQLIRRGRTYGDILGGEITGKVGDLTALAESALFTGDNAANSNQPSGMLTLIRATSAQVIANTSGASGAALVLANLDSAIDAVRGPNNRKVIFGSRAGVRRLNAALQSQQQFVNMTEIRGGFRVKTYDDIPIVASTGMVDTLTWSGSDVTAFTGGTTTALVVVSLDEFWIEELTPITVMPLARTTAQTESFDIFGDHSFPFAEANGGAILGGLSL